MHSMLNNCRPSRLLELALLAFTIGCSAQQNAPPSPTSQEASVRPGINRDYADADVETWEARFETESREIYHERERIVDLLQLRPGMSVADIGAGTGFFTRMFAHRVGPTGRVFAVDIVPSFLHHIDKMAKEGNLGQIRTVLCKENSVELPADCVDLAFVCDTYHHFEYPQSTLRTIHRALRTGGTLFVIDFERIEGHSRQWVLDHVRAGRDVFSAEITSAGFVFVDQPPTPFLKENYMLRFEKP